MKYVEYIYIKKVIENNQLLKQQLNYLELMEFRYRNDVAWLEKNKRKEIFLNALVKMDIICEIPKKEILLDEQEERVIKKQIKECISEHENMLTHMAESQEDDFFAIYSQMGVDKFGHIIAFYGLLEKYFRIKSKKTKEEKKTFNKKLNNNNSR